MSEDLTSKLPQNDSQKLNLVLATVQNLDSRTVVLESRMGKIELQLDKLDVRCNNLDSRMKSLDDKLETRLHDTRPMWEQVVASVAQLQQGQIQLQESQQRLEQNQDTLHHDSREVKTFLRDILRRISIFNDTLLTMQADYRDIYDRVRGLELKGNHGIS
jgi:chromosome segregation ATPase